MTYLVPLQGGRLRLSNLIELYMFDVGIKLTCIRMSRRLSQSAMNLYVYITHPWGR